MSKPSASKERNSVPDKKQGKCKTREKVTIARNWGILQTNASSKLHNVTNVEKITTLKKLADRNQGKKTG